MKGAIKVFLCLDMDAFFASVEEASNPKLKGKPIAVIGAIDRTVVLSASYKARSFGVKTGMNKYEAKRVCPFLMLVVGNNRKYTFISKKVMEYLITISPYVYAYSIDEAFIDMKNLQISPDSVAFMIKTYIYKTFDITCSIGVGPNKFIAKMASSAAKPDGYLFIDEKNVETFLDNFELKKLWGVGESTAKKLNNTGIFNTADIRNYGKEPLCRKFGKYGEILYNMACGLYKEREGKKFNVVKSVSHSMTLIEKTPDYALCRNYLLQLSEMVSSRVRKHKLAGKTISLYIRYADMTSTIKSHTVPYFTSATHNIYEEVSFMFNNIVDFSKYIRQLGISLSNLIHSTKILMNIFDTRRYESLYSLIDTVNNKYGDFTICYASILNCRRRGALTVSPAWKPDGVRYINVR